MNGKGVERWPDGSKFEGMYDNGNKEGHGSFTWADGNVYEGNLEQGNIEGKGICCSFLITLVNRLIYVGGFRDVYVE